jgi:type I restriction enzyme S subunit
LGIVKATIVPLPALSEQDLILRRVTTALAEIDRLTAEAAAARRLLDRLDQAILSKAFRGELVPQNPADEPASVLLERIKSERAGAPKASRRGRPAKAA